MRAMLSPVLRRHKLAAQLRHLCTEGGLTQEQVAKRLEWSPSKMSRVETGHRGATSDDSRNREAVSVLGGAGFAPDEGLHGNPRRGSRTGDAPEWDELRARAGALAAPYLESMLALSAVVDEAVLHRVIGGDAVMSAQLEQIIHAADLPKVTLRVIPFDMGAHPAMDSTFSILEFNPPCPVRCMLRGP